jgi:hypothetical protein
MFILYQQVMIKQNLIVASPHVYSVSVKLLCLSKLVMSLYYTHSKNRIEQNARRVGTVVTHAL